MAGNTWGQHFTVTSFGESHGAAIGCVIDGCPPGIEIDEALLQIDLDRRKPGTSRYVTQRREADEARIVSGVFEGRTTGTPIAIIIENTDQRSRDYSKIKDVFRPNHADYAYNQKYGFRDYRGGGRSSARETAVRVAAGAVARKMLADRYGIEITGYVSQIGTIKLGAPDPAAARTNPFFCAEPARIPELEDYINQIRRDGDSVGARIEVMAGGVPAGWGEPVFDRLDADSNELNDYNHLLIWPLGKPDDVQVVDPDPRDGVEGSLELRGKLNGAIGFPYYKIEGLAAIPGERGDGLLLFDADCPFCRRSVRWLLAHERSHLRRGDASANLWWWTQHLILRLALRVALVIHTLLRPVPVPHVRKLEAESQPELHLPRVQRAEDPPEVRRSEKTV